MGPGTALSQVPPEKSHFRARSHWEGWAVSSSVLGRGVPFYLHLNPVGFPRPRPLIVRTVASQSPKQWQPPSTQPWAVGGGSRPCVCRVQGRHLGLCLLQGPSSHPTCGHSVRFWSPSPWPSPDPEEMRTKGKRPSGLGFICHSINMRLCPCLSLVGKLEARQSAVGDAVAGEPRSLEKGGRACDLQEWLRTGWLGALPFLGTSDLTMCLG